MYFLLIKKSRSSPTKIVNLSFFSLGGGGGEGGRKGGNFK